MDMLDIFALTGLEWLYEAVEHRHGKTAAVVVISVTALAMIGAIIWFFERILAR